MNENMETWYQFIYFNGLDIVCGVRLYKNQNEFYHSHSYKCKILKEIVHILPTGVSPWK